MKNESRATWLQLLIGMSYWASWPVMIVLMYQTQLLSVSEALLLLIISGASGLATRILGSMMSPSQSAIISRFHNFSLLLVSGLGFWSLMHWQVDVLLYTAVALSGYSGLLYARAFDLSLVGTRADLTGNLLPSAWVVGIIIVAVLMAYLAVPLVVMIPLPFIGTEHALTLSSGNLFVRHEPGTMVTLASFPLLVLVLFTASCIKQWCFPRREFFFQAADRKTLSPELLKNPHFWYLAVLYNLTLGTFIGFSFVLPLVLEVAFGYSTLMLAWMVPFLAILARPLGHWLGRLYGGTIITQIGLILMALFAALAARQFELSEPPQEMRYFDAFFISMLGLVLSAAMANGSVVVTLHKVLPTPYLNRALTWVGSFAILGAFYLPLRLSLAMPVLSIEQIMAEVGAFFVIGFLFNYVIYLRRHGDFYNP